MTQNPPDFQSVMGASAPIPVRSIPTDGSAMYFAGGAEQATRIIDWVLAHGGTATWSEAYEGFSIAHGPDVEFVPGQPEHLSLRTFDGVIRVPVGCWIVLSVEEGFRALDTPLFKESYACL